MRTCFWSVFRSCVRSVLKYFNKVCAPLPSEVFLFFPFLSFPVCRPPRRQAVESKTHFLQFHCCQEFLQPVRRPPRRQAVEFKTHFPQFHFCQEFLQPVRRPPRRQAVEFKTHFLQFHCCQEFLQPVRRPPRRQAVESKTDFLQFHLASCMVCVEAALGTHSASLHIQCSQESSSHILPSINIVF